MNGCQDRKLFLDVEAVCTSADIVLLAKQANFASIYQQDGNSVSRRNNNNNNNSHDSSMDWVHHLQIFCFSGVHGCGPSLAPFRTAQLAIQQIFTPLLSHNSNTLRDGGGGGASSSSSVEKVSENSASTRVNVQRKMADLSVALVQCVDDVCIPDVVFEIHPFVIEAMDLASRQCPPGDMRAIQEKAEQVLMQKVPFQLNKPHNHRHNDTPDHMK